jgi:hypothetical protein
MEKYKSLDKITKHIVVFVLFQIILFISTIIMFIKFLILRMIFY